MTDSRFGELSVVVLAYNEFASLEPVLAELISYLEGAVTRWEILVVDDGSTDGTGALADRLAAGDERIKVFHHEANGGMGAGLQTAYPVCRYDWVTFLPADGQIDPTSLDRYFGATERAELVSARYEDRPDGPIRWVLSRGLRMLIWLATGSRVRNEAPYLFRRALWEHHRCDSRSFFLNQEFVIRCDRAGVPIATVTSWARRRHAGHSKVAGARRIWLVFSELLSWRLRGLPPRQRTLRNPGP